MVSEELIAKFNQDQFAVQTLGIEIVDAKPGYAKCAMAVKPMHFNAAGNIMGGAIFTLADFTYAVAVNGTDMNVVSVESSILFLELSKGPVLYGEAVCLREGKRLNSYRVDITDSQGVLVATVNVLGMPV